MISPRFTLTEASTFCDSNKWSDHLRLRGYCSTDALVRGLISVAMLPRTRASVLPGNLKWFDH